MPVNLIGIELEGAWTKDAYYKILQLEYSEEAGLINGRRPIFGTDGSAHVIDYLDLPEAKLEKLKLRDELELRFHGTIKDVFTCLDKYYPDYVSEKCGGHIHVSFDTPGEYMRVATRKFYYYFRREILKWAKSELSPSELDLFMPRYEGENSYCCNFFIAERQMMGKGHHGVFFDKKLNRECELRYACLNYAYLKYKTLECRLMPMFENKETHKKAIAAFVKICNDYLEQNTRLGPMTKTKVVKVNTSYQTKEILICV